LASATERNLFTAENAEIAEEKIYYVKYGLELTLDALNKGAILATEASEISEKCPFLNLLACQLFALDCNFCLQSI
jgi:hypothetical protein